MRRCAREECGLLWLDPMPAAEDIGKAYAEYYTHAAGSDTQRPTGLRRRLRQMKGAYQARTYGYDSDSGPLWSHVQSRALQLLPVRRESADNEVRFLEALPGGRLLDVGCGTGEWLSDMRGRRWDVEGVEPDQEAVQVARSLGLEVHQGSVEQQAFPDGGFQAVTLCHVIEHVPDPRATIAECHRILAPGGRLVVATPNSDSLSRRFFGRHWRGLEPPRHLSIFTMQSLSRLLQDVGFERVDTHPQRAYQVLYESHLLRKGIREYSTLQGPVDPWAYLMSSLFGIFELPLIRLRPHLADCVTLVARKGS